MKNRLLVLIIILFSIGANGKPASRDWKNAFWAGGGAFLQTTYDRQVQGRIYSLSDVSGLHVSIDNGENWNLSNRGIKTNSYSYIHQSEKNPNVMYIIGKKLMRSDNRGRDWIALQDYSGFNTRSNKNIAVDRTDAMKLFVADDTGHIYRCTSGGVSCYQYDRPVTDSSIQFLYITQDNKYLIVGFTAAPMKRYDLTDNSSTTITLSGTNATRNWDYSTFTKDGIESFCVTAGKRIQCSRDDGNNWQIVTSDMITDSTFFISAVGAKQLANGSVRLIGYARRISTPYGDNILKVTNDSGFSWSDDRFYDMTYDYVNDPSKVWGNFGAVGNVYHIEFSPFDENEATVSTDWTIIRSIDGGINWIQRGKGNSNQVVTDCEVAPDDIGTTFCSGMDIGLYRSEDGLETWEAMLPHGPLLGSQGFAIAGHYWKILILGNAADWNARHGKIVVFSSQWTDFVPRVWYSNDNGDTWAQGSGLPTTPLTFNAWNSGTSYVTGDKVYIVDPGNVQKVYTALQNSTNVSPYNQGHPTYWQLDTNSKNFPAWGIGYPRSATKAPGDKIYVCIDGYGPTETGGIFYSTDYGHTFNRTNQPAQWKCYNGIAADPTDLTGNTILFTEFWYASPDNPHGYKSTSGGINWEDTGQEQYVGWEMKFADDGKVYKIGKKTGPQVYYSLNKGSTWLDMKQLNETDNTADGLVFDPDNHNRLFVGVNDATKTSAGPGVGINSTVYMTDDASSGASATWVELTGDFDCPSGIHDLAVNKKYGKAGILIAATDGCGVKKLELSPTMKTKFQKIKIH